MKSDMKQLASAKLGPTVAAMYFASLVEKAAAFTAEQVFADDEELSSVVPKVEKLPVAKRVQTCDSVLEYLKENAGFLSLDPALFQKTKHQLSCLIAALDPSTKLLFAQKIVAEKTVDGESLIELLFDVFEQDLLDTLDLSDETRKAIQGGGK